MNALYKLIGFTFILFTACTRSSIEYNQFYAHLQTMQMPCQDMHEDDYFLVILVDACHLDYSDTYQFFQSVAIHPCTGSTRNDLGHAWIYLQGKTKNGSTFVLEGGHSGESQTYPVGYFEGIMNYNECGYSNPNREQLICPRYERNPIKYLWTVRQDGFFQKGSGRHNPSFAAKISLTFEQYQRILSFIRPSCYPYSRYALMGDQCCTFVAQVAVLAGLHLDIETTMHVAPALYYRKARIRLWEDPCYSKITFSTPDMVEKSLMQAVRNGQAEYALDWYLGINDPSKSKAGRNS